MLSCVIFSFVLNVFVLKERVSLLFYLKKFWKVNSFSAVASMSVRSGYAQ